VIAIAEEELQRAPGVGLYLSGVEVGNPSTSGRQLDVGDRRLVAEIVGAHAREPRLPGAVGREGEPRREETVSGQHLDEESMAALIRVVPAAGDSRSDRETRRRPHDDRAVRLARLVVIADDARFVERQRELLPLLLMAWVGLAIHLLKEREDAAEQALHDEIERKLALERQTSEAQLQVLQSQIEPHFLFNSLAHVRRLYQTNPAGGRAMLRYLSSYLGAAEPVIRERGITLGQDVELAVAYLNIQRVRMGARLGFDIDVPDALRPTIVPPMMLTTLVENAIKHGLSPLPEGGLVRIAAHADASCVRILVSDTGQGFQANLGAGVGLANVRARLGILYADAASLSLSQGTPRGITATVVVPARYRSASA
jgi:hypothetical protein